MPDILRPGQWERVVLSDSGAIEINLVSHRTVAELDVAGTSTAPKRRGASRTVMAFPARAVEPGRPVTVRAVSTSREAFAGDEQVDLVIGVTGGDQSYLIRGLDVAGQVEAVLAQLERDEGRLVLRPGEGGSATLGLGGWCVRRLQEVARPCAPVVRELLVDTSASMRAHDHRVEVLTQFLSDMAATAGSPPLTVVQVPVGGVPAHGVGAPDVASRAASGTVLVTDVPPSSGETPCLLIGPSGLTRALPAPRAFVLDAAVWSELDRADKAFTSATFNALTPLLTWLTAGEDPNGGAR